MDSEDTSTQIRSTGLRGWPAAVVGWVLRVVPDPVRVQLLRHREVLKFLIVGGFCWLVTVAVNYALKLTVLDNKPLTAMTLATIVATVLSYVLNREWAFRARGGRERPHEAALFFAINCVAVVITDVPLWCARYLLDLRVPDVSRIVQEISDFTAGPILGTLLAMAFRLWAYRKWVFPKGAVQLVGPPVARVVATSSPDTEPDSRLVA